MTRGRADQLLAVAMVGWSLVAGFAAGAGARVMLDQLHHSPHHSRTPWHPLAPAGTPWPYTAPDLR